MANETVSLARAAWQRLKKDRGSWSDWIIVGGALLEGRAAAMRNARAVQPLGTGYGQALGTWMLDNRARGFAHGDGEPARYRSLVGDAAAAPAGAHELPDHGCEALPQSDRDQDRRARHPAIRIGDAVEMN